MLILPKQKTSILYSDASTNVKYFKFFPTTYMYSVDKYRIFTYCALCSAEGNCEPLECQTIFVASDPETSHLLFGSLTACSASSGYLNTKKANPGGFLK